MTTILVQLDDASNIKRLLDFIKQLKGNKQVEIKDDANDLLAALAPTKQEYFAGLMESAREVEAAIQGKTKLRSAYDVLAELEAEQNNIAG